MTYHGIKNQVYAVCSSSKLDTCNLIMTIGGWVWGWGKNLLEFVQKNLCPPVHAPNQLDSFSRFDTIPACDRQTDRQTDRHTTTTYRASIASRGNNSQ